MPTIRFKLRTDATDKQGYAPISLVYQNGRKETFCLRVRKLSWNVSIKVTIMNLSKLIAPKQRK